MRTGIKTVASLGDDAKGEDRPHPAVHARQRRTERGPQPSRRRLE